jgi:hypothetical protein
MWDIEPQALNPRLHACRAASISFFVGSSAAMFEPVASDALTNNLLVVYPYAAGSVLYMLGAQLYKRSAFEGLHRARRSFSAFHPACAWARTEVKGGIPVAGPQARNGGFLTCCGAPCHMLSDAAGTAGCQSQTLSLSAHHSC